MAAPRAWLSVETPVVAPGGVVKGRFIAGEAIEKAIMSLALRQVEWNYDGGHRIVGDLPAQELYKGPVRINQQLQFELFLDAAMEQTSAGFLGGTRWEIVVRSLREGQSQSDEWTMPVTIRGA